MAAEFSSFDPTTPKGEALSALRAALVPVAAVRNVIDAGKLGYWLRNSKGRPVDGLKFVVAGKPHGTTAWAVEPA